MSQTRKKNSPLIPLYPNLLVLLYIFLFFKLLFYYSKPCAKNRLISTFRTKSIRSRPFWPKKKSRTSNLNSPFSIGKWTFLNLRKPWLIKTIIIPPNLFSILLISLLSKPRPLTLTSICSQWLKISINWTKANWSQKCWTSRGKEKSQKRISNKSWKRLLEGKFCSKKSMTSW